MFRRRREPPENPDITTIPSCLMRMDAKLDRLKLLARDDPDDE
jgi:hypothetical protein